jgi:hypothetical protein
VLRGPGAMPLAVALTEGLGSAAGHDAENAEHAKRALPAWPATTARTGNWQVGAVAVLRLMSLQTGGLAPELPVLQRKRGPPGTGSPSAQATEGWAAHTGVVIVFESDALDAATGAQHLRWAAAKPPRGCSVRAAGADPDGALHGLPSAA